MIKIAILLLGRTSYRTVTARRGGGWRLCRPVVGRCVFFLGKNSEPPQRCLRGPVTSTAGMTGLCPLSRGLLGAAGCPVQALAQQRAGLGFGDSRVWAKSFFSFFPKNITPQSQRKGKVATLFLMVLNVDDNPNYMN